MKLEYDTQLYVVTAGNVRVVEFSDIHNEDDCARGDCEIFTTREEAVAAVQKIKLYQTICSKLANLKHDTLAEVDDLIDSINAR